MGFKKTFYVEDLIGEGGFGKVYKIFDPQDMKHYALKTVPFRQDSSQDSQEARKRLNESRLMADCYCYNIVRYFGNWITVANREVEVGSSNGYQILSSESSVSETQSSCESTESSTQHQEDSSSSAVETSSSKEREQTFSSGSFITFRSTTHSDGPLLNCFDGNYLCIQMELCLHETLKDWITMHNERQMNQQAVLHIMSQLVSAVTYLHKKDIIHRDIKTENIFIQASDSITDDFITIKLGDFGLARKNTFLTAGENSIRLSPGVGTLLYMAPEVKDGRMYDCKADVYSCGIVFLELLSQAKTCRELIIYLDHYKENSRLATPDCKFACYVDEDQADLNLSRAKTECEIIENMIATFQLDRYHSWKCLQRINQILSSKFPANGIDSVNDRQIEISSSISSIENLDFRTPNWFNGVIRGVYPIYGTYCTTREQLLPVILFEDGRTFVLYEIMICKELQFFDYPTALDSIDPFFVGLGPKGNRCLQDLRFYNSEFLSDELLKRLFQHYENLRTFSYFNKSVDSKGVFCLEYLAGHSETLEYLTLRGITLILRADPTSTCNYSFPVLKTLALVDCDIDERIVKNLNQLFPHLKHIVFVNNSERLFQDGKTLPFVVNEMLKRKFMKTALVNYYTRGTTNELFTAKYEKFCKNHEGKIDSIPITSLEFVKEIASIFKKYDIYSNLGL